MERQARKIYFVSLNRVAGPSYKGSIISSIPDFKACQSVEPRRENELLLRYVEYNATGKMAKINTFIPDLITHGVCVYRGHFIRVYIMNKYG